MLSIVRGMFLTPLKMRYFPSEGSTRVTSGEEAESGCHLGVTCFSAHSFRRMPTQKVSFLRDAGSGGGCNTQGVER